MTIDLPILVLIETDRKQRLTCPRQVRRHQLTSTISNLKNNELFSSR